MIDEATYDDLDRYFHSRMNADEKSAFDSKLSANEELRAEIQWLNTMLGGMKQQGRSVMKSTIAGAIAGVSYNEVEKYKPTLNRKPFFKKFWWIVTSAIVAIGAAVAIYLHTTQHSTTEGHDEQGDAMQLENGVNGESGGSGFGSGANLGDSCAPDERKNADSVFKTVGQGRTAIRETVDVRYGYLRFDVDEEKKVVRHPRVIAENDTTKEGRWRNKNLAGGGWEDEYRKDKTRSMGVTTGYKPYPPYTYKLDDDLMLNAPYYTCKGFIWEGMGTDTVYMTTKDGITYQLLRGRGVRELVPVTGRGEPVNYNPVRK